MGGGRRLHWYLALFGILVVGAVLRLWGIRHGLPYVYNVDEYSHFVMRAIGLFGHSYNPGYFVNPPGFTYVLHTVYSLWFGGGNAVGNAYATDPGDVYLVGRVVTALFGVLGIWVLYVAAARLFDRAVGLLSAALMAVAFLPAFYSHQALNDVPAMLFVCIGLWAAAGILDSGRLRHYIVGGLSVGVGAGFKYTAGIILLPIVAAVIGRYITTRRSRDSFTTGGEPVKSSISGAISSYTAASQPSRGFVARSSVVGLLVVGLLALVGFIIVNPYSALDFSAFWDGVSHQQSASNNEGGKLGAAEDNGIAYYLWSLTWGLGWVPTILVPIGMLILLKSNRRLALTLIPAPVLFTLFMGMQGRFYGRWLLPIYPILIVVAAFTAVWLWRWLIDRGISERLRPALAVVVTVLVVGQGAIYTTHNDLVLARKDTRQLLREWMQDNVDEHDRILVEPIVPGLWFQNSPDEHDETGKVFRWRKILTSRAVVENGKLVPPDDEEGEGDDEILSREDYGFTLHPDLIDQYEEKAACYIIVGSIQKERSFAEPEKNPSALDYYAELERRSNVVAEFTPYDKGKGPVKFNFDWAFDYYPLAYYRPGPLITVYELKEGRCYEKRMQRAESEPNG